MYSIEMYSGKKVRWTMITSTVLCSNVLSNPPKILIDDTININNESLVEGLSKNLY